MKNIVFSTVLAIACGAVSGCSLVAGKRIVLPNDEYIVCTPCIEIKTKHGRGFGFVWY